MRLGDDPQGSLTFVAPHGIAIDSGGAIYVAEVRQAAEADPAEWHKAIRKLVRVQ